MFVGFNEQYKTYRLLDVSMNKIVVNRDVIDEKISFFSNNGKSMDNSVRVIVVDCGTHSSVEIKHDPQMETSKKQILGGVLVEKRVILRLHKNIRRANKRDQSDTIPQ
jgi:hypothetical protein